MFGSLYKEFLACRSGTIATVATMVMPVVVGGFGLGAEAGYWYFTQRKLQNSADVAAYAGASLIKSSTDQQLIQSAVLEAAVETGYDTKIGTLSANWPPVTGAFSGDSNALEITLQENLPRLFTSFFLDGDVSISGRAVAQVRPGLSSCIIALDKRASGAVTFSGTSDAVLDGCSIHANSLAEDAVTITGSGKVQTPCVSSSGGTSTTSGLTMSGCRSAIEHADTIDDPFATVPSPPLTAPCEAVNDFGGPMSATYTISGGRYCGGLTMKRTITMEPGIYVVDGGTFTIESHAAVVGPGVTIFLTNGASVSIAGGATVELSAPTSGDYKGILFFVDRDDPTVTHIFNGNSSSFLNGAIYAATGHVEFAGTSSVGGGCTQIVAKTVEITGTTGIGNDCTAMGFNDILNEQIVMLVE